MNRAFTCSHVRLSRRIGGVFRPETIAVIVEKFCIMRHRCKIAVSIYTPMEKRNCKLTSAMLMKCFTILARFCESSLARIDSATQLAIYIEWVNERMQSAKQASHTLLLSWMIVVMLSAVLPGFASRERCRHSIGRIFLYRAASMSVSWRDSSTGSISSNLSFLEDLGMMGAGGVRGTVFVVLIGASPPRSCAICQDQVAFINVRSLQLVR